MWEGVKRWTKGGEGGVNGRLPKNIIKSHGMRRKGVKVKGGRRRGMMGEKSTPKELGIANQSGAKRLTL